MMPHISDYERQLNRRNWTVLAVLAGLAVLIFTITIVKIKLGAG